MTFKGEEGVRIDRDTYVQSPLKGLGKSDAGALNVDHGFVWKRRGDEPLPQLVGGVPLSYSDEYKTLSLLIISISYMAGILTDLRFPLVFLF